MSSLRLPRHRATTAHLCSAYPFLAEAGCGTPGVYLGTDVLTGGAAFSFDPFETYGAHIVTNPNMLIAGEPGTGKSAAAKCLIYRSCGVKGRWVAIADPKGEYRALGQALGLDVVKLHPGGSVRINPLDAGPAEGEVDRDETARRRGELVGALVGSVLHRDLSPLEDAALGWTVAELTDRSGPNTPTLGDVAAAIADPTETVAARARMAPADLARQVEAVHFALDKLLDRSLRGMFDGPTNVRLDWSGPGVVIDLSSVHHDADALALVLLATTAWLQAALARPSGPLRLQVLDEAWSLLGSPRTARYLQRCWKLGRTYGVANLAVVHRLSDLRSQADDGTATAKVGMGLLADTQTRVLFRQSSDQIADATQLLGLKATEAEVLSRLCRGRAIWKIGGRTAVVQHEIAAGERAFCDTDARMTA